MHMANLVVRHPQYNRPNEAGAYSHDIALVRLATPSNVTPIPLPSSSTQDFAGSSCTIAGWGRTETGTSGGSLPDNLQKYSSKALSHSECQAIWGSNVAETNICISGTGGACNGDSGGPMICNSVLAGVTSFGASGCYTSHASVYTRVSAYLSWISQTIAAN